MWMGISTNGIGKISIPVATPASKSTSEADNKNSFADIMELSSNVKADTKATMSNKPAEDTANKVDLSHNTDNRIDEQTKPADSINKYEQQDKIKDNKSTDALDEVSTDQKDALRDVIKKVIDEIYHVLEEKLGCTEQDIEDILEDMGMLLQDLLAPNNLKEFVLQFNNATEVDLLISEQLPNLVSDIQNAIADILDEFGVTAEDVTGFLDDLKEKHSLETANTTEEIPISKDNQTVQTDVSSSEEGLLNFEEKVDIVNETTQSNSSSTNADTSRDNQSSVAFNLNQAIEQTIAPEIEGINDFQGDIAQADIIRQVVEAVRVNLSGDQTSMTLQLNPENLGRVQISVIQKNGIMQAQIIAENEAAKNAIESNLALLQESLEHQELKVESVEVMIASYEFFNQQEQQSNEQNSNQTSRRTTVGGFEDVDEAIEDEVLEDEIMRAQGNSVNYSI